MAYIPYSHQYIDKSDIKAVARVLKSEWLTQGPRVREFEYSLCNYSGARYAVGVSSGTAGLHIACLAAGIESGDEVITSPITFVASANCILYCGGKPIFADVENDTINIDPQQIIPKINQRTRAIIPVHYAGHPCDMEEIYRIAKRHNLIVIEDAAHALGAKYKKSIIGSGKYSDMTVFSFHPLKSITTGEGGAILTNDKRLYEKLLLYRNHGITKDVRQMKRPDGPWYYEMQMLGLNYRITDMQCALGFSQLKKLHIFINKRRKIVRFYANALSDLREIRLPTEQKYLKSAWHLYPIRLKTKVGVDIKRKRVFEYLRKKGIGAQVHYIPVYLQPYYRKVFGYREGLCPLAEDYYRRTISIPLYPQLNKGQMQYIVRTLKEILR